MLLISEGSSACSKCLQRTGIGIIEISGNAWWKILTTRLMWYFSATTIRVGDPSFFIIFKASCVSVYVFVTSGIMVKELTPYFFAISVFSLASVAQIFGYAVENMIWSALPAKISLMAASVQSWFIEVRREPSLVRQYAGQYTTCEVMSRTLS